MTYYVDATELRKAMIDKDFTTIESLSNASGVNRNTISDILSGKSRPSSAVIERLSDTLGFDGETIGRIFFKQILA